MKTLKIYTIVLILISIAGIVSCEDSLTVDVASDITDQSYWQSEGDYQTYLNGIYDYFRDRMNDQDFGEDRSDFFVAGNLSRFSDYWNQVITPENSRDWQQFYALIGHTNLLLDKIESFSFSNEEKKNQIKAEALSLRASMYFYIAKIYGDVPVILEPIVDANPPLLSRTPVEEVFVQINKDISSALSLYPNDEIKDKYYFSKSATYALQADVNLWNAKVLDAGEEALQLAINAIEKIEEISNTALVNDFSRITERKNEEIIFSIHFSRSEGEMYAKYALPIRAYSGSAENADELPIAESANTGYATYTVSPEARSLFEMYPNDNRIPHTYVPEVREGEAVYYWPNKFKGHIYSGSRIADDDMIMYRLGGLLLLKAEAYAALGKTTEALVALNRVRQRAEITTFSSNDISEINQEILDERGRELFHENKRWWDLVRAHKWGTINIYESIPNLQGKSTPIYWPVHIRPLSLNPNLEQIKGY